VPDLGLELPFLQDDGNNELAVQFFIRHLRVDSEDLHVFYQENCSHRNHGFRRSGL
jgi:hypothetical protein